MDSNRCFIGISLGNTNSVIAYTSPDGRTEVIADKEGDRIIPFILSHMGEEIFHGNQAKKRIATSPESTYSHFRDNLIDSDRSLDVVKHLTYLKTTAENFLGKVVDGCILAVPCRMDKGQVSSLEKILQTAGFAFFQIIREPTASLLGYTAALNEPLPSKQLTLVLDCGGTSCSGTLIQSFDGRFGIIGSNWTEDISGRHFDEILRDYLLSCFQKDTGKMLEGVKALAKLEQEAEQARITLSSSTKATISIDSILGDLDFHTSISKLRADMLFRELYKKFTTFVTTTINSFGVELQSIESIVLSGGLTNTPKLISMIENLFPDATLLSPAASYDRSSFALEACARGAAAQASILSQLTTEEVGSYLLISTPPLYLFQNSLVLETGSGRQYVLVQQNRPCRAKYCVELGIEDEAACVRLFEGSRIVHSLASDVDADESEDENGEQEWETVNEVLQIKIEQLPKTGAVLAEIHERNGELEFMLSCETQAIFTAIL